MSFFRNIRSSITRGKSCSRDNTPVREENSRPGSVTGGSMRNVDRRFSIESGTDSILNRGDTFIVGSSDQEHSSGSQDKNKKKKSKVLSKFSTFTKRKKTPSRDIGSFEHHPSDDAANTYFKWSPEAIPSDYDAQTDPFHFLYEQPSSLKDLHYRGDAMRSSSGNENSPTVLNTSFDSSTYRKSKLPLQLKTQLEQVKTPTNKQLPTVQQKQQQVDQTAESDKYKTITLNSLRKSFRDKFLQSGHETPHNPAWFVEVQPKHQSKGTATGVATATAASTTTASSTKRKQLLVFENENYRPESRSPIRSNELRVGSQLRHRNRNASPRSPVKRNETFRVERQTTPTALAPIKETHPVLSPTIRIEFKNSIKPHMPGRLVPVGVATPMPMKTAEEFRKKQGEVWQKPQNISSAQNRKTGRHQTLVQINSQPTQLLNEPYQTTRTMRPQALAKANRSNSASRFSTTTNNFDWLNSQIGYQKPKFSYVSKPKHTYFGDHQQQHQQQQHQQQLTAAGSKSFTGAGSTVNGSRTIYQSRVTVPTPRRSRSPQKLPWR